jgi:acetyl esterase
MKQLRMLVTACVLTVFCINAGPYQTIDPTIIQFVDNLTKRDGPPLYTLTPEAARKILDDIQAPSVNTVPADIQDIMIPGKITSEISLRIVRPKNNKNKLPVIIYIHGGGWILGNKNTHDRLIREIANGVQAAVVFVNYSLSPEAHYPVALEQAYEALEYVAKQGKDLSLDSRKIAVMGDSVGGLMTAVVAQLAKERAGPKIIYQVLLYPVTDAIFNTGSYQEFAQGPWLTKKAMQWFWDAYAPDRSMRTLPAVAPLRASTSQLQGLPPALIMTNENDVLRDEGEAYAHKLMQSGVQVSAVRILGAIHDLAILAPIQDAAPAKLAIDLVIMKLKQAFRSF